MPLCTLHLLALHPSTPSPLPTFLSTLRSTSLTPLVISRVIRWIILPSTLSTEKLLAQNIAWDILLILPSTDPVPAPLKTLIREEWNITAGVPSRLVTDFARKNSALLHPAPSSIPPLSPPSTTKKTTPSAQDLSLSADLDAWIDAFVQRGGHGAVSMFNLLAFRPGRKAEYVQYGNAFAASVGSAHGGCAKIVGTVTHVDGVPKRTSLSRAGDEAESQGGAVREWDEIALAQYPSILHFRDMLASEEYQAVNQKFRVPSLLDTAILMTSEVLVEEVELQNQGEKGRGSKL
ncbi:hypothetical protein ACN47E_008031 [Coniothyrium glycines]